MGMEDQRAIIANAVRLLEDATLLVEHERYASAFALSVLALEETGKVVLALWGKPETSPALKLNSKRPSAHIRKQAAVSSLLLGESLANEWGDVVKEKQETEGLIERMFDNTTGRFHWMVGIGALDKMKQIALYRDDWSIGVTVDGSDVEVMLAKCFAVTAALDDQRAVRVGKAIYEAGMARRGDCLAAADLPKGFGRD
jgi:AbiV family abortive infection protein